MTSLIVAFAAWIPTGGSGMIPAIVEEEGGGLLHAFGEMHPALVHFPIALALAAALAEVLALTTKRELFSNAARYCIVIAALGSLATVPAGWIAGSQNYGPLTGLVNTHRVFGTIAGLFIVATAIVSEVARRRGNGTLLLVYRIGLFASAAFVSVAGYIGGKIVHGG
jgi:uncharacterized membrane protein